LLVVHFVALYASFLEANREPPNVRLTRIKELLHRLPRHNLETFHVVARHLNAVASMEHSNMVLFSLSMLINTVLLFSIIIVFEKNVLALQLCPRLKD